MSAGKIAQIFVRINERKFKNLPLPTFFSKFKTKNGVFPEHFTISRAQLAFVTDPILQ
jgi:uncharacterized protein YbcV (DUF1398 family)